MNVNRARSPLPATHWTSCAVLFVVIAWGTAATSAEARFARTDSAPQSLHVPIAITHVSVIDGADPAPRTDQTVVIRGNLVVAVGPSRSTRAPGGARVVDGRGKFLIPGLWDMHVHTTMVGGRELLALYVANGVTGVRDMAGDWDHAHRLARRDRPGNPRRPAHRRLRSLPRGRRRSRSRTSWRARRTRAAPASIRWCGSAWTS